MNDNCHLCRSQHRRNYLIPGGGVWQPSVGDIRQIQIMNDIRIFNNEQFGEVRVAATENGEPLFCAADVCKALSYSNGRDAIARHVDEGDVVKRDAWVRTGTKADKTEALRQTQMSFVNESGLYALIFGSKLETAKAFKRWVTSEVLPSIRKHGMYATPITIDRIIEDPDFGIQLLNNLKEERQKRVEAESQVMELSDKVEEMRPKAEYYDSILASPDSLVVTQIAKDYGMTPQEFNKRLAALGIQYKVNGQWVLYAKYQGEGYTDSRTGRKRNANGSWLLTVWTQKGRLFLYTMLKEADVLPVIERRRGYRLPPIPKGDNESIYR